MPKKISAIVSPDNCNVETGRPSSSTNSGILNAIVTAPIASGMCSVFGAASRSAGFRGASDAPKTIVFAI